MEPFHTITHSSPQKFRTYSQVIENDSWPLQVIQDVFAFGENISLCIFDYGKLRGLWRTLSTNLSATTAQTFFKRHKNSTYKSRDYAENLSDSSDDMALPGDWDSLWHHVLPIIEKELWITKPSNEFLLIHEFRHSSHWRMWEILWLYSKIGDKLPTTTTTLESYAGIESLNVVITPILDSTSMLMAGPLFSPCERHVGGEIEKTLIEPAVVKYRNFQKANNAISRSKERLLLTGQFRLPQTVSGLFRHLQQVDRALGSLLRIQLPMHHRDLRQCDHASLAEWSLFLSRNTFRHFLKQTQITDNNTFTVFFRFDHAITKSASSTTHACQNTILLALIFDI